GPDGPHRRQRDRHRQRSPRRRTRALRRRPRGLYPDYGRRIVERRSCRERPAVRSPPPESRPRMSLFDTTPPEPPPSDRDPKRPLAERMRPERLEDFVGQEHILGPDKPLRRQIERDQLTSLILWGPP